VVRKGQALARFDAAEAAAVMEAPAILATAPAVPAAEAPAGEPAPASPITRRLAAEHGIDLSMVKGSGARGRITEKDVQALIDARGAAPAQSPAAVSVPGASAAPSAAVPDVIPLAGTRAVIARRMQSSLQTMAQLTLHTEADVTGLVQLRERLKASFPVTYTDLIVRASTLALKQHPRLNATVEGEAIRLLPDVHIGIAVALDDGLIVPVARSADKLSLRELAETRVRLAEKARANQLGPAEVTGGTFTVTNLGGFEIDGSTPIINPPEVAILGVGRIVEKVVVHQGKVAQRAMLTLSLTFDHRVVDGAPAAAFLQAIKQQLEAPAGLE
jgi:pyruvate/2-oxoglutarate dehydrogenase complex dihydrolipoamide acyltransferase (E2) component